MKKQTSIAGYTTGSFINYVMGNNSTLPEVGKGCTVLSWTDRHAYEVMEVSTDGKRVVIQQYLPERCDNNGMSEMQDYKYEKLNGYNDVIVWRNGAWRRECSEVIFAVDVTNEVRQRADIWDDNGMLLLVDGVTKIRKSYPKVNILWGTKQEYYDYSF